jgi:hypothetical protein
MYYLREFAGFLRKVSQQHKLKVLVLAAYVSYLDSGYWISLMMCWITNDHCICPTGLLEADLPDHRFCSSTECRSVGIRWHRLVVILTFYDVFISSIAFSVSGFGQRSLFFAE